MTSKGPLGLPAKERGGVFFLFGDDHFRKERESRALVDWHLDPATKEFNFDVLRGSEVSTETLASVLATPPMMADWRVVLLKEVEALAGSSKARDVVMDVVASPPPGLALVLLATIPKGSSAKFYRDLKRRTRSVEFPEITAHDIPGWIVDWTAGQHNREITLEAARALGSGLGTDLGVLAQEVEKLCNLVPEGQAIGVESVRSVGTSIPTEDRWVWMDRVGHRDFTGALNGLSVLLAQGESGVGLTIGMATHLLRIALARSRGAAALESDLPKHQRWLVPRLLQQAKAWTGEDLEEAILGLRRADRLMKSSSLSDEVVLEEWLLGLKARRGA